VHQDEGHVGDGLGIEGSEGEEAGSGDQGALARGEREGSLELAQCDPNQEGAGVGQGGVLERAQPVAGAVAVDWRGEMVRIEKNVERMRDKSERPDGDEKSDQAAGDFGQGRRMSQGKVA